MARKAKAADCCASGGDLFAQLSALARAEDPPDPILWLEAHRSLSRESSREVGPFNFERAPYMREVQRAILSPQGNEIAICWASQCGKSELILNSLLYWSAVDPAPGLVVVPDWRAGQSFTIDRIRPMMRDAGVPTKGELPSADWGVWWPSSWWQPPSSWPRAPGGRDPVLLREPARLRRGPTPSRSRTSCTHPWRHRSHPEPLCASPTRTR